MGLKKNVNKHIRHNDTLSDIEIKINNDDNEQSDDSLSMMGRIQKIKRALSINNNNNNGNNRNKYSNSETDDITNSGSDTETILYNNNSRNSIDSMDSNNTLSTMSIHDPIRNTLSKTFDAMSDKKKIPRFISEKMENEETIIKKIKNTGRRASKKNKK